MKLPLKFLALLMFLFVAQLANAQKNEKEAVQQSFENYMSAILNDQGEDAANYIDSRTVAYYSKLLESSKTADSVQIESMSILDKLMLFSIRHRTSKEDILSFDGKSLFVHAVKNGMVGKNSVANNAIGEVIIDKGFAKAEFINNGRKTPFYFEFYKEEGSWKMDLTALFPVSNLAFQNLAEQSGENENDYLFLILELLTGNKPGPEIWMPLE